MISRIFLLLINVFHLYIYFLNFLLNNNLFFTNNRNEISKCNVFIITVPTPVYKNNLPDLRNLISAIDTVAKYLKFSDTVILESTVYPGFTDEVLIPILKSILDRRASGQ